MKQYFNRVCRVVIDGDNQLEIENCKISFELIKSANAKENTGKIEIHNLTPATRSLITASNSLVRLFAGYAQNKGLVEIGQGDIASVVTSRNKTETITKIHIAEGRQKIKLKPVSLSYDKEVRLFDVLRGLEEKSGFKFKCVAVDTSAVVQNGYSSMGAVDLVLDELSYNFGFSWSIQGGVILIQGSEQNSSNQIMLLNAESGLILIPEMLKKCPCKLTNSSEIPPQGIYIVHSFLQPHLQIGDLIAVESRDVNGRFKIKKITHSGDTRGNDWYSNMEVEAA